MGNSVKVVGVGGYTSYHEPEKNHKLEVKIVQEGDQGTVWGRLDGGEWMRLAWIFPDNSQNQFRMETKTEYLIPLMTRVYAAGGIRLQDKQRPTGSKPTCGQEDEDC